MVQGTFCPQCGHKRLGNFRYCTSCRFDFDTATAQDAPEPTPSLEPRPNPATQPTPDRTIEILAGIAWLIAAVLLGYLGLQQFQAASVADFYGLNADDYRQSAIWNLVSAAITLYFGVRVLRTSTVGLLGWSVAWAIVTVLLGIYQINEGFTGDVFLGYIVASGAAGILSLVAARQMPSFTPAEPLEPPTVAARPQLTFSPPPPIPQPEPKPLATDAKVVAGSPAVGQRRTRLTPRIAVGLGGVALTLVAAYVFSTLTGRPSAASSSPSPSMATPRPQPTLDIHLGPGSITFAKGSFKIGEPVVYTAHFSQSPLRSSLAINVISTPIERVVEVGTVAVGASSAEIAGSITYEGLVPGTYVLRLRAGDTSLAEGTFTLVK